ncbi:MAG: DUF559 domain-containing protein [Acidimicrobiales bacterium]|nr:DUF559 domain-containing protein [Acidimicrobiales bacterium]
MRDTTPDIDLLPLASAQHSVFSRAQALNIGFTDRQISTRLDTQRWQALGRGLYRLPGSRLDFPGRVMAACLAIPSARASHETAAQLHGIDGVRTGRIVVTVTPGTTHRSPLVDRVHEYSGLSSADTTVVAGIPTISIALTLFHLAAVLPRRRVHRLLDSVLVARRVTPPELFALADSWTKRGRRGRRTMLALLRRLDAGYQPTESELEFLLVELLDAYDITQPTRQFRASWLQPVKGRIDFAYPLLRIVIEVDGRRWHSRDSTWERDLERDRVAQLEGWLVLRFSYDEVTERPDEVAATIRSALTARRSAR